MELLRPEEIERLERDHPRGLPASAIVELFTSRGVRLSQATFRKYVQAGLLPRSRRVGRKGKHTGSQGLYPVDAVRRLNAIRKMMALGATLEDIKSSFVVFKNHLEEGQRELLFVLDGLEAELARRPRPDPRRRELTSKVRALKVQTRTLTHDITRLVSVLTARGSASLASVEGS